jgi:hypothetical protein
VLAADLDHIKKSAPDVDKISLKIESKQITLKTLIVLCKQNFLKGCLPIVGVGGGGITK